MSTKQPLSLSKGFVFGVLGLAFILVLASSLLTFHGSRKLAHTLEDLTSRQHLTTELESRPLRLESLLHQTRLYMRTRNPEDLDRLKTELQDWNHWPHQPALLNHGLTVHEEINQLSISVTAQLNTLVILAEDGRGGQAAKLWMQIEDKMPVQKMHALTAKLIGMVREDFRNHASTGRDVAMAYQRTGAGFVILAVALGLLAAWLLGRRMRELETFITVCAWTKRVKHDGRWVPFEEFLEKRFRLKLSHGISEEAALMELERVQVGDEPDKN